MQNFLQIVGKGDIINKPILKKKQANIFNVSNERGTDVMTPCSPV
jgi:hypothetical protein